MNTPIMRVCAALVLAILCAGIAPGAGVSGSGAAPSQQAGLEKMVGRPVDIASSAYLFRADRRAEENPPESWLAVMRCADLPLNQPLDRDNAAVKRALCALLWEEIRPIRTLELTWGADAGHRPGPGDLSISTLDQQGNASSWWNNLKAVEKPVRAVVSGDGNTYSYDLRQNTCGVVVSVGAGKSGADFAVPTVRVLVGETWKKMDLEIEWGFDAATADKEYSGRAETYDGALGELKPLDGDPGTTATGPGAWRSVGKAGPRRGVKASLLYMGTSKWRHEQPWTSQTEDVARTIVTVWTKAGNFSFLAADLENGPILAPEYGFFVRRTSELAPAPAKAEVDERKERTALSDKMTNIAGDGKLVGWGADACPWFGSNPTDQVVSVQGITFLPHRLAVHPGAQRDVAVGWRSPIEGSVMIEAKESSAQDGGNGIEWWIAHETKAERRTLVHDTTEIPAKPRLEICTAKVPSVSVQPGDLISLVVGPKGSHSCDTTLIDLVITEVGGQGRVWNLTQDVGGTLHAGNPHADSQGNADVWQFYSEPGVQPTEVSVPSDPPFSLASRAASAREFIKEIEGRKLSTVRERIRARDEQTWQGAVTAMRGVNLPPHPVPPAGSEPAMKVEVPSERLTAQWNLGAWHLVRHAERHPTNGRLWFNDYPYGILGAETYMVLAALDLMGSHTAAEDGFDQWVSLPMDPSSKGHHEWALSDRPNGLFSEGHGCMTHAVGPPGFGGQMDGVHAFGPGSIGWALTEHYWLTGDKEWLKASAPRLKANIEWMLRQRRVVTGMVPGGERLWCKGLQPALQVTPDSGGLWMQFYECEAYYWSAVSRFAATLSVIDPAEGARLAGEAESYRKDLRAAVERSIALSPVVAVRDGTYRSVIPFACYVRGLSTGAWGWKRDGSGQHVGPLYWETVQSAAALVSPAGLLPASDVRVQGYLDVLEDRLLLENPYVGGRDWFAAGWQYQGGLERTANMHLSGDDVPVFIRSFLNCYAIDILPDAGYTFNEHAVHGPPDKIFEEAAFLERFRNLLVMEEGDSLWIARATPRDWLRQGKKISVRNAPTHFGVVSYEIESDVDHGKITATVEMPGRQLPGAVRVRLRHLTGAPIKSVTVNGKDWKAFDRAGETIEIKGLAGTVVVTASY